MHVTHHPSPITAVFSSVFVIAVPLARSSRFRVHASITQQHFPSDAGALSPASSIHIVSGGGYGSSPKWTAYMLIYNLKL
jgi:hypothetical protein